MVTWCLCAFLSAGELLLAMPIKRKHYFTYFSTVDIDTGCKVLRAVGLGFSGFFAVGLLFFWKIVFWLPVVVLGYHTEECD